MRGAPVKYAEHAIAAEFNGALPCAGSTAAPTIPALRAACPAAGHLSGKYAATETRDRKARIPESGFPRIPVTGNAAPAGIRETAFFAPGLAQALASRKAATAPAGSTEGRSGASPAPGGTRTADGPLPQRAPEANAQRARAGTGTRPCAHAHGEQAVPGLRAAAGGESRLPAPARECVSRFYAGIPAAGPLTGAANRGTQIPRVTANGSTRNEKGGLGETFSSQGNSVIEFPENMEIRNSGTGISGQPGNPVPGISGKGVGCLSATRTGSAALTRLPDPAPDPVARPETDRTDPGPDPQADPGPDPHPDSGPDRGPDSAAAPAAGTRKETQR